MKPPKLGEAFEELKKKTRQITEVKEYLEQCRSQMKGENNMDKYICKIDGSEFSNEEELIDYIKTNYINVVNTDVSTNGLSCENIFKSFRELFPDHVDIKVKTDIEDGGFLVNINSSVCDFSCKIGEGEWNYYYNRFTDVDDAINHYKEFFEKADEIIEKAKERYDLDLEVNQMWESAGEGNYEISFDFKVNNIEEYETYEFEDVDHFVKKFEQYVSNALEGKLEKIRKEYHTEYKINGVPIDGFVTRSKKVRLEILE